MRLAAGISGMRTSSGALDERCQKIRRLEDKGPSFGVMLLGQHVDRDPELHAATIDLNLVVGRVGASLGPSVDHLPGQNSISRQRHGCPSSTGQTALMTQLAHVGPHRATPHGGSV
jgi:hypothetical protein